MRRATWWPPIVAAFFILYSCSSLSSSQKTIISQMATSGKTYGDAPKAVLNLGSECLYKSALLRAATSVDTSNMMKGLEEASSAYLKRTDYDEQLSLSYQLIGQYFQAIADLAQVDTSSDLKTNIGSLGTNIDSLSSKINTIRQHQALPVGFGLVAGNLLTFAGKSYISHKEWQYVNEFVKKGQPLIDTLCGIMHDLVIGTLVQKQWQKENAQLRDQYRLFYSRLDAASKTPSAFYKDLNPDYLSIKTTCGEAVLLCDRLDSATMHLKNAHDEMARILSMKRAKKVRPESISVFANSVTQLTDLIAQFKPSN